MNTTKRTPYVPPELNQLNEYEELKLFNEYQIMFSVNAQKKKKYIRHLF